MHALRRPMLEKWEIISRRDSCWLRGFLLQFQQFKTTISQTLPSFNFFLFFFPSPFESTSPQGKFIRMFSSSLGWPQESGSAVSVYAYIYYSTSWTQCQWKKSFTNSADCLFMNSLQRCKCTVWLLPINQTKCSWVIWKRNVLYWVSYSYTGVFFIFRLKFIEKILMYNNIYIHVHLPWGQANWTISLGWCITFSITHSMVWKMHTSNQH